MPTADIFIRIPGELNHLAEGVVALTAAVMDRLRQSQGGKSLDYSKVEVAIAEEVGKIERAAHGAILAGLNSTSPRIVYQGGTWNLVATDIEQEYRTRAGPVVVARSLYSRLETTTGPPSIRSASGLGYWAMGGCQTSRRRWPSKSREGRLGRLSRPPWSTVSCRTPARASNASGT